MKRPESIDAKLIRFKNGTENWIAFVGLVDDRPYEVFTGINNIEDFPIPSTITEGKIIKVKMNLVNDMIFNMLISMDIQIV